MRFRLTTALPKTGLEWLIIAVVVAILILVLLPGREWASSGTINVPVHVVVFDGKTARPVSGAMAAIIWAPPATGDFALVKYQEPFSAAWKSLAPFRDRALVNHTGKSRSAIERWCLAESREFRIEVADSDSRRITVRSIPMLVFLFSGKTTNAVSAHCRVLSHAARATSLA